MMDAKLSLILQFDKLKTAILKQFFNSNAEF